MRNIFNEREQLFLRPFDSDVECYTNVGYCEMQKLNKTKLSVLVHVFCMHCTST